MRTGKNYTDKSWEGPHLTITAELGLATPSQTQWTLSSMSQCCCKGHVYKVFSHRLHKQLAEKCQVLFLYSLHQFNREKRGRYVYELWWIWWCLLIIDNSILACPDRMFSARIMFIKVPPHRGLSGTVQAGRKCLMMVVKQSSNGSASETTWEMLALAALAYPRSKEQIWGGGVGGESNTTQKSKEVWKNLK